MTVEVIYSLYDIFDEALQATQFGTNRRVIEWLQMNRRSVLDANQLTIETPGLEHLLCHYRKKSAPRESAGIRKLCQQMGLEFLDLDLEITVPQDPDNPLFGSCKYEEIIEVTADDVKGHRLFLRATAASALTKEANYEVFELQMELVGDGRRDIPLRELIQIAARKGISLVPEQKAG